MCDKMMIEIILSDVIATSSNTHIELTNGCILYFSINGEFLSINGEESVAVLHELKAAAINIGE